MTFTFDDVAAAVAGFKADREGNERTNAAVAMILREGPGELELLLIQRAADERDPWSGNLAFPGGRVQPGEEPRRAAVRETLEEIGLGIEGARQLGRLPDVHGAHLPVRVACFIYGLDRQHGDLVLNNEVFDTFWIGLDDLANPERHVSSRVSFDSQEFDMPAISIPRSNTPVLWGLTYRFVMQLLAALSLCRPEDRVP